LIHRSGLNKVDACRLTRRQERFFRRRVGLSDAVSTATPTRSNAMLGWALTFLIVALIAAVLGFGGIAGLSIEIAKIIFFVAILLFAISAIVGLMRRRTPTVP
jgi:uncharacterized membrane protein YtjA (UPF0391 family)